MAVVLPAVAIGACASQQPIYEQQARVQTDTREQSALGNNPRESRAQTMYDDAPETQAPVQNSGKPTYTWNGNPERETFQPGYEAGSAGGDDARQQARQQNDAYRPPDA